MPSPPLPKPNAAITKGQFILIPIVIVLLALAFLGRVDVGPHPSSPFATEIHMLSAASEAYKNDTGHYPTDPTATDQLNPNTTFDPQAYIASSAFLYHTLSGGSKNYLADLGIPFKLLKTNKAGITYIVDPWGNSLGYSTFKSAHPGSRDGYNPTFDLWSTGGGKDERNPAKWIRNW